MSRTSVRFGRVAALAAAVLVVVLLVAGAASGRTEAAAGGSGGAVHVVRAGDTLWDIASGIVGPEGDPRPLVQDIREANALATPALRPGMRLVIPAA